MIDDQVHEPAESAGMPDTLRRQLPPAIPALGFLITAACAGGLIYGHPGVQPRYAITIVGIVALAVSIASLRMVMLVDADGIAVRLLRTVQFVPWEDVKQLQRATVRGNETMIIVRRSGSTVVVPPTLVLPALPTSKRKAAARVDVIVAHARRIGTSAQH
jgi:hypothetical protein